MSTLSWSEMGALPNSRLLLLDFCGDPPLLALAEGDEVRGWEQLADRSAVAEWLPTIKRLLQAQGWTLTELDALGVVAGPGSFTGVRTGLAAAKGLCEAASLKLAAVSRLALLAAAAGDREAFAALYAGKDQLYVRWPEQSEECGRESLVAAADLPAVVQGRPVAFLEARLHETLSASHPQWVTIGPEHLLAAVRLALHGGESSVAAVDANYVRSEGEIYRKTVSLLSVEPQAS